MPTISPAAVDLLLSSAPPLARGNPGLDLLELDLELPEPRAWLGGPSENCWVMLYDPTYPGWFLEGGDGLVKYGMSGSFDCAGPNTFDVLVYDLTLQAPPSITVWPFSPAPCNCPDVPQVQSLTLSIDTWAPAIGRAILGPAPVTLTLTPKSPALQAHIGPALVDLDLNPYPPEIFRNLGPYAVTLTLTPAGPGILGHLEPTAVDLTLTPTGPDAHLNLGPTAVELTLTPPDVNILGFLGPAAIPITLTPTGPQIFRIPAPSILPITLTPEGPKASTTTPSCTSLKFVSSSSQYGHVPNLDSLASGTFSVSAWVKINTPHLLNCILFSSTAGGWALYTYGSGGSLNTAVGFGKNGSSEVISGATSVNDGNWHNVMVVLNPAGVLCIIYLDGSVVFSGFYNAFNSINNGGHQYNVAYSGTTYYGDMNVMDLRVYNNGQTSNYPAIYNSGCPNFSDISVGPNLVGWWKMNDGSGATFADSGTTGNGTTVNSPTWPSDCPCP